MSDCRSPPYVEIDGNLLRSRSSGRRYADNFYWPVAARTGRYYATGGANFPVPMGIFSGYSYYDMAPTLYRAYADPGLMVVSMNRVHNYRDRANLFVDIEPSSQYFVYVNDQRGNRNQYDIDIGGSSVYLDTPLQQNNAQDYAQDLYDWYEEQRQEEEAYQLNREFSEYVSARPRDLYRRNRTLNMPRTSSASVDVDNSINGPNQNRGNIFTDIELDDTRYYVIDSHGGRIGRSNDNAYAMPRRSDYYGQPSGSRGDTDVNNRQTLGYLVTRVMTSRDDRASSLPRNNANHAVNQVNGDNVPSETYQNCGHCGANANVEPSSSDIPEKRIVQNNGANRIQQSEQGHSQDIGWHVEQQNGDYVAVRHVPEYVPAPLMKQRATQTTIQEAQAAPRAQQPMQQKAKSKANGYTVKK